MDLIPVVDSQEYIICDRDLIIVQFSSGVSQYTDRPAVLGDDVRLSLPEIVGLETVCQEILSGQRENFALETISRNQQLEQATYFSLFISAIEGRLAFILEDVTEATLVQQSSVQQLNEAEILLSRLQRFEYCTNKIIASMRDVLLITSPQGKIERVNKSTTELFKQKTSELINQSIDNLINDPTFNHQRIYSFLLSSRSSVRKIEVSFLGKQEQLIQIEFDCFIAPTEVRNFFNCVYIGRDITARKQAEMEIRKSLAREKELRELKSGFISMASHEFRNPLSSILLCIQNLQENDNLNDANREFYLQSIKDAALTMNSLLEDVLILSKAESDQQILKPELIDLREFCNQAIQKLGSIYADKTIDLNYTINTNLVNLDRAILRNILSNLLSNALKYSPSQATVQLTIERQFEPEQIKIQVSDRGIGIPAESQKHLFESFYRASNVNSIPGTGLGLSIVKKSVDLYQGAITVDSKLNQGTTITVTLPIK